MAIIWPPDLTIGTEKVYTNSACDLFTYATCPGPGYIMLDYEGPSAEVIADMANIPNETPWLTYTDYTIDTTTGDTFCAGYGIGQEIIPMWRSIVTGPCN